MKTQNWKFTEHTPGGLAPFLQPLHIGINKIFKDELRKKYTELVVGTEIGKAKGSPHRNCGYYHIISSKICYCFSRALCYRRRTQLKENNQEEIITQGRFKEHERGQSEEEKTVKRELKRSEGHRIFSSEQKEPILMRYTESIFARMAKVLKVQ